MTITISRRWIALAGVLAVLATSAALALSTSEEAEAQIICSGNDTVTSVLGTCPDAVGVAGLEVVRDDWTAMPAGGQLGDNARVSFAECPAGKVAIGGGVEYEFQPNWIVLQETGPANAGPGTQFPELNGWRTTAINTHPTQIVPMRAVAYCVS